MKKKVLLIVIDALTSRVLGPAIEKGKLPNFKALAEIGSFDLDCISIFPSITHAATASLATGSYPQHHGIAGTSWYNIDSDDFVHYSDDFWIILNRGLEEFFEDFIVRLNHHWLQAQTIFQTIERAGLKTACINHIIFRGDTHHTLNVPLLLSLLPGIPRTKEILGPASLYLGDFTQTTLAEAPKLNTENSGLFNRFGFDDDYAVDVLIHLAQTRTFPDFTLAYLPDNDYQSHKLGPEGAIHVVEHIDKRLGELFTAYGGLKPLLQDMCLVITGDHAQSDVLTDEEGADINLNDLLAEFSLAEAGQPWHDEDDLVICPNSRMAQIYFKQPTPSQFDQVTARLLQDDRIDQVMWRAEFTDESPGYRVVSADRGKLLFWPEADNPDAVVDRQGNAWSWAGDLSVLDGQVTASNKLSFADYPNAFERIKGGLECKNGGHLWVTARPGYEFSLTHTAIYAGGGSHGSLHALDSVVPLLVAGAPGQVNSPSHPRIVDVALLCLSILGLNDIALKGGPNNPKGGGDQLKR